MSAENAESPGTLAEELKRFGENLGNGDSDIKELIVQTGTRLEEVSEDVAAVGAEAAELHQDILLALEALYLETCGDPDRGRQAVASALDALADLVAGEDLAPETLTEARNAVAAVHAAEDAPAESTEEESVAAGAPEECNLDDVATMLVTAEGGDVEVFAAARDALGHIVNTGPLPDAVREQVENAQRIAGEIADGKGMDAEEGMEHISKAIELATQELIRSETSAVGATASSQATEGSGASGPDESGADATQRSPESIVLPGDSDAEEDEEDAEEEAPPEVFETLVLPADTDPDILQEFTVESLDHIVSAEAALLEIEADPEVEEPIHTVFRAFHTVKGTSGFLGLVPVQRLAHVSENLLDRARNGEIKIIGGYADLALSSCDALRVVIESLGGLEAGGEVPLPENFNDLLTTLADPEAAGVDEGQGESTEMRVGDILVGKGRVERDAVEKAASQPGEVRIGEKLVRDNAVSVRDVADALRTQKKLKGSKAGDATIRVATARLDNLADMVGELVIAHSMIAQQADDAECDTDVLARNVNHAGKITRNLQDLATSLRMVPLKATFRKMTRLVRDLARKAGKQVEFVIEGDDTEIDRNMVEVLNDPLVHMIRNAVDHGVETPDVREGANKDSTAVVSLKAYHSGGNVVLELTDDGKGLDRDRILAKARDRGLVDAGDKLSDPEVFGLIFEPGFSTAEKVTDISGRGVGMDVVKRSIESLRGVVEVASALGKGSTFSIRVPLTMAITDAMLLGVGDERYLLPTMSIVRSFRPESGAVSTVTGRGEIVTVRGKLLPVIRLNRLLNVSGGIDQPEDAILVIVENQDRRCAMMVDELLGKQQIVIKSLGRAMGQIDGISGAAILGDGRVGLILDAGGVLNLARQVETGPPPPKGDESSSEDEAVPVEDEAVPAEGDEDVPAEEDAVPAEDDASAVTSAEEANGTEAPVCAVDGDAR